MAACVDIIHLLSDVRTALRSYMMTLAASPTHRSRCPSSFECPSPESGCPRPLAIGRHRTSTVPIRSTRVTEGSSCLMTVRPRHGRTAVPHLTRKLGARTVRQRGRQCACRGERRRRRRDGSGSRPGPSTRRSFKMPSRICSRSLCEGFSDAVLQGGCGCAGFGGHQVLLVSRICVSFSRGTRLWTGSIRRSFGS